MYVSAGLLRQLMLLDKENTGVLQLYLKDMDDIPAVQERLRQKLPAAGYRVMEPDARAFFMKFESVNREDWTGQKLDVTSWADEVSFITWKSAADRR